MGYFFQCYTSTLWEHKLPLPYSVLWSENHMIIKACSRNITDYATTPLYNKKNQPKGLASFPFKTYLSFLANESWLMFLLSKKMLFYPVFLNVSNSKSNHINIGYVLYFVWPMSVNTWYWFNLKLSTDSESSLMGILKRKRWVNIVRYWFFLLNIKTLFSM